MRIDKLKKIKVKKSLKEGRTAKDAMLDANYAPATAHNATQKRVVQECQNEIAKELKAQDYTAEVLIAKTESIIKNAQDKGDITNQHRGVENIARFVGIDKPSTQNINVYQVAESLNKDNRILTKQALPDE